MIFLLTWAVFTIVFGLFLIRPSEDMTVDEFRNEVVWPKFLVAMIVGLSISVMAR